jgi:hypothetical protein
MLILLSIILCFKITVSLSRKGKIKIKDQINKNFYKPQEIVNIEFTIQGETDIEVNLHFVESIASLDLPLDAGLIGRDTPGYYSKTFRMDMCNSQLTKCYDIIDIQRIFKYFFIYEDDPIDEELDKFNNLLKSIRANRHTLKENLRAISSNEVNVLDLKETGKYFLSLSFLSKGNNFRLVDEYLKNMKLITNNYFDFDELFKDVKLETLIQHNITKSQKKLKESKKTKKSGADSDTEKDKLKFFQKVNELEKHLTKQAEKIASLKGNNDKANIQELIRNGFIKWKKFSKVDKAKKYFNDLDYVLYSMALDMKLKGSSYIPKTYLHYTIGVDYLEEVYKEHVKSLVVPLVEQLKRIG